MYEVDELANLVAMANDHEQTALTEDISNNGQREPAVLWRGKLVDGRCRQLACHALGIDLAVRELDELLVRDEVAQVVKSLNTRRNLTDTQKCMSAFKQQEAVWETNEVVAKKWGIPFGTYKNARYVAINNSDVVEPLFNGKSVKIFDPDKGVMVTTNKINTLARIVKKTKEFGNVIEDNSEQVLFKEDAQIKTEAGKAWYYSAVVSDGVPDDAINTRLKYIELANYKFKMASTLDTTTTTNDTVTETE